VAESFVAASPGKTLFDVSYNFSVSDRAVAQDTNAVNRVAAPSSALNLHSIFLRVFNALRAVETLVKVAGIIAISLSITV
jgi:hypothetical protein